MAARTSGDGRRGDRFVSEPVAPCPGSFDTGAMAAGEPGLPLRFHWRGDAFEVAAVLERWKDTGPCRHGASEQYVRRHWYRVRTRCGRSVVLYCSRQAPRGRARREWVLYTISAVGA